MNLFQGLDFQGLELGELTQVMQDLHAFGDASQATSEALWEHAREGRREELAALLDAHPNLVNDEDEYLEEPLLNFAAGCGHVGIIQELLKRGADLQQRDHGHFGPGKTALRRRGTPRRWS